MNKLTIVSVALSALVFAVLIPALELNSSHLFNPLWPSHARLHEAWQLLTNASIAILALYLVYSRKSPTIGIRLCLITGVPFLIAWAMGGTYGGSMLHSDGTQMAIAGVNAAVIIVAILTVLLVMSDFRERKRGSN